MSEISVSPLWDLLRRNGLEHIAVVLVKHGVHSVNGLAHQATQLVDAGVEESDVTRLLSCIYPETTQTPRGRGDLPVLHQSGQRASLTLALVAAQPNNRKRSLDDLDKDILARSSEPAQLSRLRTYGALCAAWGVAPFPLSVESIRCCAASLKAGHYRSAALYFQAAVNHQLRFLREPVHPLLRSTIKDVNRSIKRGLGPARLKEGFDVFVLSQLVDTSDADPFDFRRPSHLADVVIIGSWFMLREIELAGAYRQHLTIEAGEIRLLIPVHKTASAGTLTSRSLRCPCRTVEHRLCPWHAAERHLIRLNGMPASRSSVVQPLMPDPLGNVVTKIAFVEALRQMLTRAGVTVFLEGDDGQQIPRFGGHSMRVSGAMMLANAKVPVYLIQLLGRWSSSAIERYIQQAPLTSVPSLPDGVLGSQSLQIPEAWEASPSTPGQLVSPPTPAPVVHQLTQQVHQYDGRVPALASQVETLQREVQVMRGLISTPEATFVSRPRSRVVHISLIDEQSNIPQVWQTKCGWSYGCSRFFRLQVIEDRFTKCKKCFPEEHGPDRIDSDDSDVANSSSSDSSSSDEVP